MMNTEAVWREVVGDELYEDEEDRRAHEQLMALDAEANLSDSDADMDFDAEDYEDFNRQRKLANPKVQSGGRPARK